MDFRILGPLEALDEGRAVTLGGSRQRALLGLLLVHANETLTTDRLIDELWGEQPPATPAKTLQMQVSRLRKVLGGGALVTREGGYELQLDPDRIDGRRFERLLSDGRSELAAGRPGAAAATLEEALALWRGAPFSDLAYEPFAQQEIARLEDLRVDALEQLVDAKLELGRHVEVVGQLEGLIAEHPYRERLRAQLMLALYRCDRQADALQAYQEARRSLVEQLGIEPGERLRELEAAILAQDPSLALRIPPHEEPRAELPTGVVTFMLTDIAGSSALWETDLDAMAAALELHDGLIARTAEEHDGRLVKAKGEGDSTLTAYPRASDAVGAAVELQTSLAATDWPGDLDLRVRIALHTGEAQERESDYFGPTLNRGARLRSLARPGATVLSQATAEIVQDRLPRDVALVDLGSRDLLGLSRPENVFELRHDVPVPGPTRKTVTVLFAGIETPQGLDAEARRRLVADAFGEMRAVLEAHGGLVAAYPGDVLMAVFGVPLLHEDDALRAVRAATEIREAVAARLGVATGEVVAEGDELPSGDAVNLAKRLEEQAAPGEVLLDRSTQRLARDAAEVEPAGPGVLRLLALAAPPARETRPGSPLVGRDGQLAALSNVFESAARERTCHLVTVLGTAGVGKSRLVHEFIAGLGDEVTVLHGRCLPYGEGITYWPLAEALRDLAGELGEHLADEPRAAEVAAGVNDALGLGDPTTGSAEQIFWAVRRLFEALARRRPLVAVFDDLQWAEPTFLDLVEHLADLSRGAPMVVLCMARPELLDSRPGWGGGKLNATSVLLEPLGQAESRELIGNLLGRASVAPDLEERVAGAAEGNPLFAEELLAELVDEGLLRRDAEGWVAAAGLAELPVPATIHALLAARLERLPDDERALLARASVEGAVFHGGAAAELAPASVEPERGLTSLVRRDVIRPDRASFEGQDAFRFRHALIRDAAYRSLSKETRAELHTRFADWLERTAGPRLREFEEIAGYHLERAHEHLADLGSESQEIARRGAERLESAGRRALARSDHAGAANLLERAAALLQGDEERRARLLPDLGAALIEAGRLADAERVLAEATTAAEAAGDRDAAAHVLVQEQFLRLQTGGTGGTAAAAATVEEVVPVFTEAGDEHGLCAAHRLDAWVHWIHAQADPAAEAWERAAAHATRAGAEHERIEILGWIASLLFFGPTPASEGIPRCEAIRTEVSGHATAVAEVLQPLAGLHAMEGRFDEARELLGHSDAMFEELGLTLSSAVSHHAAAVELLAGRPEAAEAGLRAGLDTLQEMGDRALLSTTAALLGQALLAQGRTDEAERFAARSEELAAADDLITQVIWRSVSARALAARGESGEAERLAREAVALGAASDFIGYRADALLDLGLVLRLAGRADEARAALTEALGLYERKGNLMAAEGARAALAKPTRV